MQRDATPWKGIHGAQYGLRMNSCYEEVSGTIDRPFSPRDNDLPAPLSIYRHSISAAGAQANVSNVQDGTPLPYACGVDSVDTVPLFFSRSTARMPYLTGMVQVPLGVPSYLARAREPHRVCMLVLRLSPDVCTPVRLLPADEGGNDQTVIKMQAYPSGAVADVAPEEVHALCYMSTPDPVFQSPLQALFTERNPPRRPRLALTHTVPVGFPYHPLSEAGMSLATIESHEDGLTVFLGEMDRSEFQHAVRQKHDGVSFEEEEELDVVVRSSVLYWFGCLDGARLPRDDIRQRVLSVASLLGDNKSKAVVGLMFADASRSASSARFKRGLKTPALAFVADPGRTLDELGKTRHPQVRSVIRDRLYSS